MASNNNNNNLNYKQVANVERRRWDLEAYEKKAAARQERQDGDESRTTTRQHADKQEFQAAPEGAAGPEGSKRAFLKARKGKVEDIDEKVGSAVMVSVEGQQVAAGGSAKEDDSDVVQKTGVGWHCTVCDCFLKDSHTYLDHINGRKHQRKLGYSMRVERSTESDLMNKLKQLTDQKQKSKNKNDESEIAAAVDYDKIVAAKDEEEQRRKEERQRKRKERRQLQKQKEREAADNQEEEEAGQDDEEVGVEEEGIDPGMDMAAMMGFSGFGSTKN